MTNPVSKVSSGACSCTVGYVCGCFGVPTKNDGTKKRGYTYGGPVAKKKKEASDLMTKKLNSDIATPLFLAIINNKPCCKEGQCLKTLYEGSTHTGVKSLYGWTGCEQEGYGKKFLDAVIAARQAVYVCNQNHSSGELTRLLTKDLSNSEVGKIEYRFYHQGMLGDAPAVPIGVRVSRQRILSTMPRNIKIFFMSNDLITCFDLSSSCLISRFVKLLGATFILLLSVLYVTWHKRQSFRTMLTRRDGRRNRLST